MFGDTQLEIRCKGLFAQVIKVGIKLGSDFLLLIARCYKIGSNHS
jgi:hypothetical protein